MLTETFKIPEKSDKDSVECLGYFGSSENVMTLHIEIININAILTMLPKLQFRKCLR